MNSRMIFSAAITVVLLAAAPLAAQETTKPPAAARNPEAPALPEGLAQLQAQTEATAADWPLYGGNYKAWRYSSLNQITPQNVAGLQPAWTLQIAMHDAFECSPIVVSGMMYVTTPWNHVYALNASVIPSF